MHNVSANQLSLYYQDTALPFPLLELFRLDEIHWANQHVLKYCKTFLTNPRKKKKLNPKNRKKKQQKNDDILLKSMKYRIMFHVNEETDM